MAKPKMTEDQRVMAIALLANAIRKEMRFSARPENGDGPQSLLAAVGARGKRDATHNYVRGMYDLLAVLFDGGQALADQCLLAARADATSPIPPAPDR